MVVERIRFKKLIKMMKLCRSQKTLRWLKKKSLMVILKTRHRMIQERADKIHLCGRPNRLYGTDKEVTFWVEIRQSTVIDS